MHKKMDDLLSQNLEVVKEYINTGRSGAMHEEHQRMLDLCVTAYGLLAQFPLKNVCIRKLMALKNLSYTVAARYVDFARQTWGDYIGVRRDFLEAFFLQRLMSDISNPLADEVVRAKNLATLQKYLDKLPAGQIDPHLMESNTYNIQVNIGSKSFVLEEKKLLQLPIELRQQILSAIDDSVDDEGAVALLEN